MAGLWPLAPPIEVRSLAPELACVALSGDASLLLWCYTHAMIHVIWPSAIATRAEVWRVLDLSGLTSSPRQSRNYIRAGYVFLDGNLVGNLKETMELGRPYRLELRFPSGLSNLLIVQLTRPVRYKPRTNQPDTAYRKP